MTRFQYIEKALREINAMFPEDYSEPQGDDRKAVEMIFDAGAAWQREQDAKLCDEHAAGYQALREHARDDVNDRLVHLCERDAAMTLAKEIRAGTSDAYHPPIDPAYLESRLPPSVSDQLAAAEHEQAQSQNEHTQCHYAYDGGKRCGCGRTQDECRCSVSGENVVCHHGRVHNSKSCAGKEGK